VREEEGEWRAWWNLERQEGSNEMGLVLYARGAGESWRKTYLKIPG
jgi:hypothetical protein